MKKILGRALMALGLLMVLGAAWLLITNRQEDAQAGEGAARVLEAMETLEVDPTAPSVAEEMAQEIPERDMTVQTIDGREYIGTLRIPALDLELPVLSEWSYDGLKIAPGRFSGSTFTDDLTVCAHNYAAHFGRLHTLEPGTEVEFRDMDGMIWTYKISEITELGPTDIDEMTVKTSEDTWSLTLFTCTPGGETRATVRCERTGILTDLKTPSEN